MTVIESIVFLILGVLFTVIILYSISSKIKEWKESFITTSFVSDYPENAPGDKEDDADDEFIKKMNAEYAPTNVDEFDRIANNLDKEEELKPEEVEYIDSDDIEIPGTNNTSDVSAKNTLSSLVRTSSSISSLKPKNKVVSVKVVPVEDDEDVYDDEEE